MFLINFYNQKGAGPKNIALNFINEIIENNSDGKTVFLIPNINDYDFNSTHNVEFIRLPCHNNLIMKALFRVYLELFLIPFLVRKYDINSLLAFGNFLFSPVQCKKIVLLHHPYLVDDKLFKKLGIKAKFAEALKRVAFMLTTKNVHTVVVQSDYMLRQLVAKYPNRSYSTKVIANPISKKICQLIDDADKLFEMRTLAISKSIDLIYVSRFYPHKNHRFLVELSRLLNQKKIGHRIMVTVDPSIMEANDFLKTLNESDVSIVNLTELDQSHLIEHYRNAHLFIFPSSAETFGNPLIEAMCYGLPILVPDLEYAHSIVGEAGVYYQEDNVFAAIESIEWLMRDKARYISKSKQSLEHFNHYPTTTEWLEQYLSLIR